MSNMPKYTSYADKHFVASGYGPMGHFLSTKNKDFPGYRQPETWDVPRREKESEWLWWGQAAKQKSNWKEENQPNLGCIEHVNLFVKRYFRSGSMFPFFMCLALFCLAYWKGKSYSKPPHFLGFMLTFQGVGVFLTVGPWHSWIARRSKWQPRIQWITGAWQ